MRAPLPRLVVATGNPGKLREFSALLAGLATELIPQSAFGISAPVESAPTFAGNALAKARHAARAAAAAALADDSGLEVDALGGAPGVHSARYAGPDADAARNTAKLLAALADVPEPRRARFRCALALVRTADDPQPLIVEGCWEGRIARAPRGTGGFGYDPVFLVGAGDVTAAELAPELKNSTSHRAQALARLRAALLERELAGG